MIQDTSCSPETFDNAFGWGIELDSAALKEPSGPNARSKPTLAQRDVVWAVNIPGEAEWCISPEAPALWSQTPIGELRPLH